MHIGVDHLGLVLVFELFEFLDIFVERVDWSANLAFGVFVVLVLVEAFLVASAFVFVFDSLDVVGGIVLKLDVVLQLVFVDVVDLRGKLVHLQLLALLRDPLVGPDLRAERFGHVDGGVRVVFLVVAQSVGGLALVTLALVDVHLRVHLFGVLVGALGLQLVAFELFSHV